ncbi:ATP-binding protein [Streptomyces sp. NPDC006332]|uniref:ATP-binding protein n=1 Tax=Streptomyces sp. NPDC006332 TaxID=3155456 RepID=UPI0033B8A9B9
MKQSAVKILGVAALGAAFAATAAGAASAAPVAQDATQSLNAVARTLPAESVAHQLPAAGEVVGQAQSLPAAKPVTRQAFGNDPTDQLTSLVKDVTSGKGLSGKGLPVQGGLPGLSVG